MTKQVIEPGTVIIHPNGIVEVKDFETTHVVNDEMSGCQEAWQVGACWALEKIAAAIEPSGRDKRALG